MTLIYLDHVRVYSKIGKSFVFSPLFTKFMVYLIIIQVGQFNCKLCKIIIILILKRIAIYYAI